MLGLEKHWLRFAGALTLAAALLVACARPSSSVSNSAPTSPPKNLGVLNLEIQRRVSPSEISVNFAMAALVSIGGISQFCTVNHVHEDIMAATNTTSGVIIVSNSIDKKSVGLLPKELQTFRWDVVRKSTAVSDLVWCAKPPPKIVELGVPFVLSKQTVKKGDPITLYDFNGTTKEVTASGSLFETYPNGDFPPGNLASLHLTGPSRKGNSGGPLTNKNGEIVAFNSGSSETEPIIFAAPVVDFEGVVPPPTLLPIQ